MPRLMLVLMMMGALGVGAVIGSLLDSSPEEAALAASRKCSKASLVGAFGIKFDGQSEKLGRFASMSLWTFDGKGGLKAAETYNSENTGPQKRQVTGKYAVRSDCTFQILFPSELGQTHEAVGACVLVANRTEFSCLDVEKGWVTTGTGVKI